MRVVVVLEFGEWYEEKKEKEKRSSNLSRALVEIPWFETGGKRCITTCTQ